MHYNHFTIDYLEAIKKHLAIEINTNYEAVFFPDLIQNENIVKLKEELSQIWSNSSTAIDIVKQKKDSTIQSGLFGLVNDLDKALKIGYLISDRVVLIDYLFDRILKQSPDKIDLIRLGSIATSLVGLLPLARSGRVVIIPNPFHWHEDSKKVIAEVSEQTDLSPSFMSLLNMLSITKLCQLHPYTIAESEDEYSSIIQSQIDYVDVIGKDGGQYAYDGILGALLSEKLLDECEMNVILDVPIWKYLPIVSSDRGFYLSYLSQITRGGSLGGQKNIDDLIFDLRKEIEVRNKQYLAGISKSVIIATELGGGIIAVAGAVTIVSAPVVAIGAIMALSATLVGLINEKSVNNDPVINVFRQLYTV